MTSASRNVKVHEEVIFKHLTGLLSLGRVDFKVISKKSSVVTSSCRVSLSPPHFAPQTARFFEGLSESYDRLHQIYKNNEESEFTTFHKITGREWYVRARPVFDEQKFIGIMIVSREKE